MKISAVTDAISEDFETAIELSSSWGITNFEIRTVLLKRVPHVLDRELRDIIRVVKEYGINISAISPGAFKIPFVWEKVNNHLEVLLYESFKLAEKLEANMVLIFGFIKQKGEK
ncbi:unnamed protein product [marine sediment metagenome]|uniref:Xylose isomerase-like TIM barrel domain-containing protein n=1 Tax=marine sediment metagenome TaxID=412755 RepID=X1RAM5_9ZZZZ